VADIKTLKMLSDNKN